MPHRTQHRSPHPSSIDPGREQALEQPLLRCQAPKFLPLQQRRHQCPVPPVAARSSFHGGCLRRPPPPSRNRCLPQTRSLAAAVPPQVSHAAISSRLGLKEPFHARLSSAPVRASVTPACRVFCVALLQPQAIAGTAKSHCYLLFGRRWSRAHRVHVDPPPGATTKWAPTTSAPRPCPRGPRNRRRPSCSSRA
ncbi:hypothetical protein ZWY2020_025528 [Hordeum vulgare]|nr:hypothetical protein ZWY2020_025528 [Hordeum vulgare]